MTLLYFHACFIYLLVVHQSHIFSKVAKITAELHLSYSTGSTPIWNATVDPCRCSVPSFLPFASHHTGSGTKPPSSCPQITNPWPCGAPSFWYLAVAGSNRLEDQPFLEGLFCNTKTPQTAGDDLYASSHPDIWVHLTCELLIRVCLQHSSKELSHTTEKISPVHPVHL